MNPHPLPAVGWRYGALGLPLALLALPLHLLLPAHYAGLGVPLAPLGALLLALRAGDALADPWIGRRVDGWLARGGPGLHARAAGAAAVLALAFHGLFLPPWEALEALAGPPGPRTPDPATRRLVWAACCLVPLYLAFSGLQILHQAWGARLGGGGPAQARLAAWREGFGLAGVVLASVLPALAGLGATGAVLVAGLAAGLWALKGVPVAPPPPPLRPSGPAQAGSPWADPGFRRLAGVHALNGVAAALPATLVLFFIRDRLQAPAWEPALLALYFAAAAVSLPLWVRAVRRLGLVRAWAAGMALALAGFAGTAALGPGDAPAFAALCALTGFALGADLAVPPALLALRLPRPAEGAAAPQAGAWFGWWTVVGKLNLALAAGLALPLLQALGYRPGAATPDGLQALAGVYVGLPCLLKAAALGALWRWRHRLETPGASTKELMP